MSYKKIILSGALLVFMFGGISIAKADNLTPVESISVIISSTARDLVSALQNQINNLKLQVIQMQLADLKQQLLAALSTSPSDVTVTTETDATTYTTEATAQTADTTA